MPYQYELVETMVLEILAFVLDTVVTKLTITDADQSDLPAGQVVLADLTMVAIYGNETLFSLTNCATPVQNEFCIETALGIDIDYFGFHRLKVTSADNNGL